MNNEPIEVSFYHLSKYPVIKALPKLLEKIYQSNQRCLILCNNEQEMADLNEVLWTYSSRAFLPHGSIKDGNLELQPILLSTNTDNLNSAQIIIVLSGEVPTNLNEFTRCLDLFYTSGNDETIAQARKRYKLYNEQGYKLTYWTQNDEGGWVKS
jgi:DNA polymerase-3 subunit chi